MKTLSQKHYLWAYKRFLHNLWITNLSPASECIKYLSLSPSVNIMYLSPSSICKERASLLYWFLSSTQFPTIRQRFSTHIHLYTSLSLQVSINIFVLLSSTLLHPHTPSHPPHSRPSSTFSSLNTHSLSVFPQSSFPCTHYYLKAPSFFSVFLTLHLILSHFVSKPLHNIKTTAATCPLPVVLLLGSTTGLAGPHLRHLRHLLVSIVYSPSLSQGEGKMPPPRQ